MEKLVANVLAAYKQSIDGLDWMGPQTKKEAQAKLAKIATKIGYPAKWRDYSKLAIAPDDLVGNVMRASRFEAARQLGKLGKPVDREEWYMTPQTVNAYYNPLLNEIVFPAAYLQPPYFDPAADDAANYGGVGATIGHEISHAFDDSGSQYDGDGNLREWWTPEDHARFKEKTKALVAQFNAYSPVPGYNVNGELTLGENIADLSGLAIAHKAYRISLGGGDAPVVDGLTGDERFFLAFAQGERGKLRDEIQIVYLKSDPHSPDKFRVNGPLSNLDAWYKAYGVREKDRMYRPPKERVSIW
jgi:predicted metalloendopeptidase